MIDITKFAAATQTNQSAQPVEPVKQSLPAQNELRRSSEEEAAAANARAQQSSSNDSPSKERFEQAAAQIDQVLNAMNLSLDISVNEDANRFITKIVNDETGEIVKQFPPDQIVEIAARLQEMARGVLVDEKT